MQLHTHTFIYRPIYKSLSSQKNPRVLNPADNQNVKNFCPPPPPHFCQWVAGCSGVLGEYIFAWRLYKSEQISFCETKQLSSICDQLFGLCCKVVKGVGNNNAHIMIYPGKDITMLEIFITCKFKLPHVIRMTRTYLILILSVLRFDGVWWWRQNRRRMVLNRFPCPMLSRQKRQIASSLISNSSYNWLGMTQRNSKWVTRYFIYKWNTWLILRNYKRRIKYGERSTAQEIFTSTWL